MKHLQEHAMRYIQNVGTCVCLKDEVSEFPGPFPYIFKGFTPFCIQRMEITPDIDHQYWWLQGLDILPGHTFYNAKIAFAEQFVLNDRGRITGSLKFFV